MNAEQVLEKMGLSESSKPPVVEPKHNTTGYGFEGRNYDNKLNIKEIAFRVRTSLKKLFPKCTFSVTIERYSMGQAMTIALMSAPFDALLNEGTEEQKLEQRLRGYAQINQYQFRDEYKKEIWNNGNYLTEECWNTLKTVAKIADSFNFNDSDSQTDYFHVNFYLHLEIGKWNKPFKKGD